jgi:predicted NAD/FAD-binding protein
MLLAVRRFQAAARAFLQESDDADATTYGEFIAAGEYPASFTELYAVPLVSCVWSSGPGDALDYPARYLFRFLAHHGMLSLGDSPQWMTVVGGSATYVDAIAARLPAVRIGAGVAAITRDDDGVTVTDGTGRTEHYDRVVVATHADEALALLADATPLEKEVLGAFRYTRNETVLHRDAGLLPRARQARASWNYLTPADGQGPVVTYWMNRLQGLPEEHPLLVTLGGRHLVDDDAVVAVMDYAHPIYDLASVAAQGRLPELTTDTIAFAGAYHGWGFHEDGCRSGVDAARAFGVTW